MMGEIWLNLCIPFGGMHAFLFEAKSFSLASYTIETSWMVPLWVSQSLDVVRSNDTRLLTEPLVFERLVKSCRGRASNHGSFHSESTALPIGLCWHLVGSPNFLETFRRQKTLESLVELIYFWLYWIQLKNDNGYCVTINNLKLNWFRHVDAA